MIYERVFGDGILASEMMELLLRFLWPYGEHNYLKRWEDPINQAHGHNGGLEIKRGNKI